MLSRIQRHGLGRPCQSELRGLGRPCVSHLRLRSLGRPRVESNPKAQPGVAVRPQHRLVQPGTAACCAVPSCAAWDGRVFSPIQMHDLGRPCVAESILCSQGRPHDVRLSYAAWDGRVLCGFGSRDSTCIVDMDFCSLGRPRVEWNPAARPGTAVRCRLEVVQPGTAASCSPELRCLGRPRLVRIRIEEFDSLGRPCNDSSELCSPGRPRHAPPKAGHR